MRETIDILLNQWEEGFERGNPPSAEALCADHPELLDELKSQIEALKAVESNFGKRLGTSASAESLRLSRLRQRIQVVSEFQLDELHASGGLGDVYRASEPGLQRQVAIKFPRGDRMNSQQLARFEREAQITGRLNHPGIVPVFSLKQDDHQQPCYVMRFVDGLTLRQRVDQFMLRHPAGSDYFSDLEFRQLLQSFVALCNIVAYAHDQGVIHRDIKPENIILGTFGETMLMDWGLAKVLNEPVNNAPPMPVSTTTETLTYQSLKTSDGQVLGTPAYASPEQLQGRVDLTDVRSDVYSMGATLHFLITGLVKRSSDLRGPLTSANGRRVPNRLAAICRAALAPRPNDRYPSVVALREDVERYLAGESISVVPESIWSRIVRTVRRRPSAATALLAVVSTAIVLGAAGTLLLNHKNRELTVANQQLSTAINKTLVAQNRSKSTTDILRQGLFGATPEAEFGRNRSLREFLDEVSAQVRTDDSLDALVAADTHSILCEAYLSLGVLDSSQEHADRAYEIYAAELGAGSAEAVTAQAHRALVLSHRDQDALALELAGEALALGRAIEGLDADSKVTLLDIFAHVLSRNSDPDHELIVALHREAHATAVQAFGANHRQTLKMASNVATALMDAGDLTEAEKTLNEFHAAHVALLGPNHPETLVDVFNLIALKHNQGDHLAANQQCRENLPRFEEVLTPPHPRVIRLRLLLAQTWAQLGELDSAAKEAAIVLERSELHLGPMHEHSFHARGILASVLIASGKMEEGKQLAENQYRIAFDAFGAKDHQTIQAATLLFDLAEAQGDPDTMAVWLEHLRGTEWEVPAEAMLKSAREKKSAEQPAAAGETETTDQGPPVAN